LSELRQIWVRIWAPNHRKLSQDWNLKIQIFSFKPYYRWPLEEVVVEMRKQSRKNQNKTIRKKRELVSALSARSGRKLNVERKRPAQEKRKNRKKHLGNNRKLLRLKKGSEKIWLLWKKPGRNKWIKEREEQRKKEVRKRLLKSARRNAVEKLRQSQKQKSQKYLLKSLEESHHKVPKSDLNQLLNDHQSSNQILLRNNKLQ